MGPPLAARLSRFLVGCYPRRWRQRFAAELLEVLDQHRPTARTVLNLWAGAVSAHLDPAWRAGRHPMIRLRRWARVLAAVAAVLLVFAVGFGFLAWQDEQGNMGPPMPLSDGVFGMAFSPDGRTLASGYDDGEVVLWDAADPARVTRIATLTGQAGDITALAFSPGGHLLASASDGGTVALWDIVGPARITHLATLTLPPPASPAQPGPDVALSFSPDGQLLASANDDGMVVLWNVADPAQPARIATLHPNVPPAGPSGDVALAFSVGGHTLTMIVGSSTVTRFNVTGPGAVTRITTSTLSNIGAGPVAFSPGGRTVAGAPAAGDTLALSPLP